ncbi:DUF4192 family protein [Kitasatospora sp. NPDC085879]|uniref:DUF4192 domain-containing protein n=1 Tax=Kitasatospora sp. NPDC085879 TaxID=3154769 RepID=UPI003433899B
MNHDEHRTPPAAPFPGGPAALLPMPMRGPADMAEMLPYLLGFFPDDSIVAVGLQGPSLQQGGVVRVDIPDNPAQWGPVAHDTAALLLELSEKRDRRPDQVLLYLVRDPAGPTEPVGVGEPAGATAPAHPVGPSDSADSAGPADPAEAKSGAPPSGAARPVESLRPLADSLAAAFREAGVAVKESLCVSGGRWWSFLCSRPGCCDPTGTPVRPAHRPSAIAAAAAFAGLAPRGSRRSMVAGLAPVGPPTADIQRQEIERAGPGFLRELASGRAAAVERTGTLITEVMAEFRDGAREVDPQRVARLLLGLQDKLGRDRGAEFAEPDELAVAQRVWRFLVQRCVSPFEHLAAPPLTLLAWTAWIAGDTATARIMLSRALEVDSRYTLAHLLYESINGGLAPERLLESVRDQRAGRIAARPRGSRPTATSGGVGRDLAPQGPALAPAPAAPAAEPSAPPTTAESRGTPESPPAATGPTNDAVGEPPPGQGAGGSDEGGQGEGDSNGGGQGGRAPGRPPAPGRATLRDHRTVGRGGASAPRPAAPGTPAGTRPRSTLPRPVGPTRGTPGPGARQVHDRTAGPLRAHRPGDG